ncbi:acyltransferase [Massilimicrobiota timonensis]|uniref:acyltransferase n=1 Tax=Massilimicrobiota timonensis TaxID=1776392 RepID=UPI00196172FE|nr:acyltransferase [Massilimicrobiota timonensis]MBM6966290.1 acyltransferase [Massilimicrobiota timonensis]
MKKLFIRIYLYFLSQKKYINFLRKKGILIGDKCEIYKNVSFGSEPYLIEIGNHVRITSGCKFITHDGGVWVLREYYKNNELDLFGKIIVGDNVHIGMNSIIMPGVTIGNNVIIGCGAVVTKDIPDNEIWGGVPAKYIKSIDAYYNQHSAHFDLTKSLNFKEKKKYLINKLNINTK